MKKIISIFTFCLFAIISLAQEVNTVSNEEKSTNMETMEFFNVKNATHGVYLGIGGGYGRFGNLDFGTFNTRIAYVYNNVFEVGVETKLLQNHDDLNSSVENVEFLAGSFGGLHLKGILFGNKKIHMSVPVFLGGGALGKFETDGGFFSDCFDPDNKDWSGMFVMDAGVNVEFNISKVVGFEMGGMYRLSSETDLTENDNLNGLLLNATIKVGYFDFGGKTKRKKNEPKYDADYIEY